MTIEAALNAELDEHLGYSRYEQSENSNSRNGSTSKTLKTDESQIKIDTPRDRDGSFEPRLVKNQTRFHGVGDKMPCLYAEGMSTREISRTFKELYGADVSPALVSKITDSVIDL